MNIQQECQFLNVDYRGIMADLLKQKMEYKNGEEKDRLCEIHCATFKHTLSKLFIS